MEKVLDKKKWKKRKLKILINRLNDGTKLGLVCSKCDEALNVTKDFHIWTKFWNEKFAWKFQVIS